MTLAAAQFPVSFRMWSPYDRVPVPQREGRVDGTDLVYDVASDHFFKYKTIPNELVTRGTFANLDLSDVEAVARFVSSHGMDNIEPWRREDWPVRESRVPLEEICASLAVLQQLARFHIASVLGENIVDTWNSRLSEDSLARVDTKRDCVQCFATFLEDALRQAHLYPRMETVSSGPGNIKASSPRADHDLLDAMSIQLFEIVYSRLPVRICQNETCPNRVFFVRDGETPYGQQRTRGVTYCSPECANMQNQRRYRRRKRLDSGT